MPFARVRSFALHENAVVRAIQLLKFEQIEPLESWLADRLAEMGDAEGRADGGGNGSSTAASRTRTRNEGRERGIQSGSPALEKPLRLPRKAVLLVPTAGRTLISKC